MNRVAAIIVNYNMPERAGELAEHLNNLIHWPHDLILVDNGSDIVPPSKHTTLRLAENVQTTAGWLMGLHYADQLARKRAEPYFAYWFIITSTEFVDDEDQLTPMVSFLLREEEAVGIHPALTEDSTTMWEHLKAQGGHSPRRTWMIDNIASLYRADWFDAIGRFDPRLFMAHGIDLETCWKARKEGRSLWVHEGATVKKVTNVGYDMGRMNMDARERAVLAQASMNTVLGERYGPDYWQRLTEEYPVGD